VSVIGRAVEGIDDPTPLRGVALAPRLFSEHGVAREASADDPADQRFALRVDLSH
jgi:hypothetical protein